MKRFALLISASAFFIVALSGCGKSGDATAKIAFVNNTGARLSEVGPTALFGDVARDLLRAAPTIFKMKLIAAYLAADIDPVTQNNTGTTAMIYLNNDCQDDIMHCDISAGTAEDGAAMSKIVTSFFDFGAASAVVNAALNAQGRAITATSYKYARLEFCKYNSANANNISWADGVTLTTGQEFKRNSCTVNSVEISPALTIATGGTVTINIAYSLTNAITTGASCTGDDSTGSGPSKICFTMPTFTPSAL